MIATVPRSLSALSGSDQTLNNLDGDLSQSEKSTRAISASISSSEQSPVNALGGFSRNPLAFNVQFGEVMRVQLLDRRTQTTVAAEIAALSDRDVERLDTSWVPAFQHRFHRQLRDEDFLMWNTGKSYLDLLIHREELQSFVLIADANVQGVLLLQKEPQPSRLEANQSLVYLRYLATAPWNRRDHLRCGWFRGVGTLLLEQAVQVSRESGCDGRLGVHSLKGSEEFYQRRGFCNLGLDAARRGLTYFECRRSVA